MTGTAAPAPQPPPKGLALHREQGALGRRHNRAERRPSFRTDARRACYERPVCAGVKHGQLFPASNLGGFYGQASYWFGENPRNGAANEDDGTGRGVRLGYASGPLNVAVGYSRTTYNARPVAVAPGSPSGDFQQLSLGGAWDFGAAKVMAVVAHDARKGSPVDAEGRGWLLGAVAPIGPGAIRASFGEYRIDGGPGVDPKARKLSLGYVHNLSKRTLLYFTAAHVRNRDGARVTLGSSTIGAGLTGSSSTGYDVGIRHAF